MSSNDQVSNTVVEDALGSPLVPRHEVLYCGACGMPLEYCEYSPDYESDCLPWLKKHHSDLYNELKLKQSKLKKISDAAAARSNSTNVTSAVAKPDHPWTTEERLRAFYEKYEPTKIEGVPGLLEKYSGKEEKLFEALIKKYGPEPRDPYFSDDDDDSNEEDAIDDPNGERGDDDEGDDEEGIAEEDDDDENDDDGKAKKKKRRGAGAKKTTGDSIPVRVVIVKQTQKKKRCLTVIHGMETVPTLKLKDVSKALSKKFAGSSSVKDKTIIVQGDHIIELAEMLVDKFQVPERCIYLDLDNSGNVEPFR